MPNLVIGPLCLRALGLWKDPELSHPQGCGGWVTRVPREHFPGAVLGGHLGCPGYTVPPPSRSLSPRWPCQEQVR